MIRRPPRSTQSRSSAASDVYKRQAPAGADARPRAALDPPRAAQPPRRRDSVDRRGAKPPRGRRAKGGGLGSERSRSRPPAGGGTWRTSRRDTPARLVAASLLDLRSDPVSYTH